MSLKSRCVQNLSGRCLAQAGGAEPELRAAREELCRIDCLAAGCVNIDLMAKMLTVVYLAMVVRLNKAGRFLKQWQQKC